MMPLIYLILLVGIMSLIRSFLMKDSKEARHLLIVGCTCLALAVPVLLYVGLRLVTSGMRIE